MKRTAAIATAAILTAAASIGMAPAQAAEPTETITCQTPAVGIDVAGTAKQLAAKFFRLMKNKDLAGLESFITPGFLAQSGDGSNRNFESFLATPLPNVKTFGISGVKAQLDGPLLSSIYRVRAAGDIAGRPYAISAAPRLSVFTFCSGDWKLVAHSNFDPLRK